MKYNELVVSGNDSRKRIGRGISGGFTLTSGDTTTDALAAIIAAHA